MLAKGVSNAHLSCTQLAIEPMDLWSAGFICPSLDISQYLDTGILHATMGFIVLHSVAGVVRCVGNTDHVEGL